MAGFGFGHGSSRQGQLLGRLPSTPLPDLLTIDPGGDWNGTAASGFTAAPADPVRATAKPVMRPLIVPNQCFTDQLLVGVYAGAVDGGSLMDNFGLSKVVVYYEGNTVDITAPSFQTFPDANGNSVTYFGWWAVLNHNGTHGEAHVYFEAVPKDATMQNRVVGPYSFLPVSTLYDYDVTVAPSGGGDYISCKAAFGALRSAGAQHPRITLIEARDDYDLGAASPYTGAAGRCTVEASVPVTFAKTEATKGGMRPRHSTLHIKGSNITFDMRYISELQLNEAHTPWMDGVNFINSGGRDELWDKGQRPISWVVREDVWLTECNFSNTLNSAMRSANLVRGCSFTTIGGDFCTSAACVVGNLVDDLDSATWRSETDSLSVHYTGSAGTATLSLSGSNDDASREFTAKEDGLSAGTFTVYSGNAYVSGTNYNVQDVADWINGLTDWTATVLDNTRRATALSEAGSTGGSFSDIDVKTSAITFVTQFDLHPDWYQNNGTVENVIFADNVGVDLNGQSLFVSLAARDMLAVNNVWHQKDGADAYLSQMNNTHSHVVLAHNIWANQGVIFRETSSYNPDAYCLVANNVFPDATHNDLDPDIVIDGNHYMIGATGSGNGSNASVGGNAASLFVDAASGDFTPAGDLLSNLKPPVVWYDALRSERGNSAPAGAYET